MRFESYKIYNMVLYYDTKQETLKNIIGTEAVLMVYVSCNKYPGKPFIVFQPNDISRISIHTAPCIIRRKGNLIYFENKDGNKYLFSSQEHLPE